MEAKTVALVQESFNKMRPIANTAAEYFYAKLFELDPHLQELFPMDNELMKIQGSKLMSMLGTAINGLKNFNDLVPVLEDLGQRHLDYKVEEFHYYTVGEALLATLEAGLGADFTLEVKNAWVDVYTTMSGIMVKAAYQKEIT